MRSRKRAAVAARGASVVSGAVLGALIGGAIAAVLILLMALSRGPVDLPFLRQPMEALAESALSGGEARIGGVEVVLREDGRLRPGLRVRDAAVHDAAGRLLFTASTLRAGLDLAALARGELRPASVELRGAALTLRRGEDGAVSFALGGSAVSAAPAGGARLDSEFSGEIKLLDANLTVVDESHGARFELSPVRIDASLKGGRLRADFDAALGQGGLGSARLRGDLDWRQGAGGQLALEMSGARTREIARVLRELTPLADVDLTLDASATLTLDGDGAPQQVGAKMAAEDGAVFLGGRRVEITELAAELDYARDSDSAAIRALRIASPEGAAQVSGSVGLRRDAEDRIVGATMELMARDLTLAASELFAETARFDSGHLVARVAREDPVIKVAGLTLNRGDMALRASGEARLMEAGWDGAARLVGRGVTAADIRALWPIGVAPGARDWVRAELEAGFVPQFDLLARFGPSQEDVAISFAFNQGTAHYLRPLPPIARGAGWGVVDLARFGLGLTEGRVAVEGFAPVELAGSTIVLPDIDDPRSISQPVIRGRGPLGAILSVLDMEPLALVRKVGIEPGAVEGRADAQARLVLPLLKDLRLDEVGVETRARLRDVALVAPGVNLPVKAQALSLEASAAQLSVAGPMLVGGAPMEVAATEVFSPPRGEPRSRAQISARLTTGRARALGIDLGDRVDGAFDIKADIRVFDGGTQLIDADLDLRDAALRAPELGWRKVAGRAASARLSARLSPAGDQLRSFSYRDGGLRAAGSARFARGGAVSALSLSRFQLDERADLALELTREQGGWRVSAKGAHLDVGLLEGDGSGGEAAGRGAIRFDAALDRMTISPDLRLRAVSASGRLAADRSGEVDLQGRLGDAQISARYLAERGQTPRVTLSTGDLGGALRGADVYADAYGGVMTAQMRLLSTEPLRAEGRAEGGGVRVARESDLARRVAAAAPAEARRLLEAEGIKINKSNFNFSLTAEALSITEGVANGPSIGLTLDGRFDRKAEQLAFSGVFTPAYGINSAIGAVPILGALLTGGEGQGVFAFNYRVEGPLADPRLVFSPLSGLAPGVLRNLFQP